ncbi:hypothetical protein VNO77_07671 [Canavalia gladiata]|uniref:Uncharacterized protein n=1 Tax=Canavalia gladiata TaxID=3824 RepID=A0AAN9M7T4_CANGL
MHRLGTCNLYRICNFSSLVKWGAIGLIRCEANCPYAEVPWVHKGHIAHHQVVILSTQNALNHAKPCMNRSDRDVWTLIARHATALDDPEPQSRHSRIGLLCSVSHAIRVV